MYVQEGVEGFDFIADLQRLHPFGDLYRDDQLVQMQSRQYLNTQYIYSIFFEKYFKNVLNEYVKKVPICGLDKKCERAAGAVEGSRDPTEEACRALQVVLLSRILD